MTQERTAMSAGEGYVTTEDGVRLFFETQGNGPQLVLLPNGFHLRDDCERLATGRTLVFYDVRNRGRSDHVGDGSKLARGIHHDVDDLDTVRRHFGIGRAAVIGHSYLGLTVAVYAMKYAANVERVVQIGPMQPRHATQYPARLTYADGVLRDVFAALARLEKERQSTDPEAFCRKFWSVLGAIYVTSPADAEKVRWGRCHLPNERGFMKYWLERLLPSIQGLELTPEEVAKAQAPILTLHGTKDRSAPYGGGREWALMLPNARLVSVVDAGHAPWIEAPELVLGAIETFLNGAWPEESRKVASLDTGDEPAAQP
jgi:proline iminopeptidase